KEREPRKAHEDHWAELRVGDRAERRLRPEQRWQEEFGSAEHRPGPREHRNPTDKRSEEDDFPHGERGGLREHGERRHRHWSPQGIRERVRAGRQPSWIRLGRGSPYHRVVRIEAHADETCGLVETAKV